jgi:hypothetical protein
MKWLVAGLTLVNVATVSSVILGLASGGLNRSVALISLTLGEIAAVFAYLGTCDARIGSKVLDTSKTQLKPSKRALRRMEKSAPPPKPEPAPASNYRYLLSWAVAGCFLIFAVRSFCWLLFIDGEQFSIQSPNNLGDLALHITHIKNFASGVALWPDNPIYAFSKLRYPVGMDFFNGLLFRLNVDLIRGLVWTGLLASLATFYAFYRWGGSFAVAGFLFNGGLVGFQFLKSFKFLDYQGVNTIAWKSIPLTMFVTQRGFLYAIPVALVLLWHWREKFFRNNVVAGVADPGPTKGRPQRGQLQPLPFWVELSLYASMPLFHLHTFLALTIVLVCLFIVGDLGMRRELLTLIAGAVLPATFFVWLITDHFQAKSVLEWHPGWVQDEGDFKLPFFTFWFFNFGLLVPVVLIVVGLLGWRVWKSGGTRKFELLAAIALAAMALSFWCLWERGFGLIPLAFLCLAITTFAGVLYWMLLTPYAWNEKLPEEIAFVFAAVAIFVFGYFVKTAPWGWDNLKLMVWAYFLVLPFLWNQLIAKWPISARVPICIALFGSGFVSLFGGLAAGREGFGFANRAEVDGVGDAVRKLPVEARFAAYPTYNHPLLLQGRKVVMGYPGHLWTQGFQEYGDVEAKLRQLMAGSGDWRETARYLRARYVFWGRLEKDNFPKSSRPWERTTRVVASGNWGAIYDLEQATGPQR